jgi:hypothetical protein
MCLNQHIPNLFLHVYTEIITIITFTALALGVKYTVSKSINTIKNQFGGADESNIYDQYIESIRDNINGLFANI